MSKADTDKDASFSLSSQSDASSLNVYLAEDGGDKTPDVSFNNSFDNIEVEKEEILLFEYYDKVHSLSYRYIKDIMKHFNHTDYSIQFPRMKLPHSFRRKNIYPVKRYLSCEENKRTLSESK